jgi:hypothetical protein
MVGHLDLHINITIPHGGCSQRPTTVGDTILLYVTDFRCPKCEAQIFFEKCPGGGGRAGGKSALINNLEEKSNHPEAMDNFPSPFTGLQMPF